MDIPRLHPDTIDEIKQRIDIVDVVQEYVSLRKRGKDYLGLCPFHSEKTPSFSVSPAKQMYYCFGCQAGGNAISFLMEIGKSSYPEVLLELARRYQVSIRTLEREQSAELQRELSLREQLYEIVAVAAAFFQHALLQPQGETALNYLKQTRQLKEETIRQFGLGYAPQGWETLYRYLVETKRYSVQVVEQAGLIKKRKTGEGYIDYFRDRLAIPINDAQGRVIGFGSRSLGEEMPKYLNSPETPLFDKGKTLFAIDKAKRAISSEDCAIVVEGYFDAIALHEAGIANAVASLGTAMRREQFHKLLRYTQSKQVIFNFDGDNAGVAATQRAIAEIDSLIYAGEVQLRVLHLDDGKDADEFLHKSADAAQMYRDALVRAPLWIDWQIQQILSNCDLKQADSFERVVQNMVSILERITDAPKRTYYVRYCAELLSQGDSRLISLYVQNLLAELKKPNKKPSPRHGRKDTTTAKKTQLQQVKTERNLLERAEFLLLLIYIHCPQARSTIIDALEEKDLLFSLSHHRFLWRQLLSFDSAALSTKQEWIHANGDSAPFFDRDGPFVGAGNELIAKLQQLSIQTPEKISQISHFLHLDERTEQDLERSQFLIRAAVAALERVQCEKHRRYCLEQWQKLDPSADWKSMQYYYQEMQLAEQNIQELDRIRHVSLWDIYQ
ncbi:MAG: DNA primase [Cyanobacteriota bacterium]|nr:DNA primase [Cyanobacteriota bacterium]